MKGMITATTSTTRMKRKTDFKQLRRRRDTALDTSDIPMPDKFFWASAALRLPKRKDRVTIRLDHDVLLWLKKHGRGYQTRINAVLRSYMNASAGVSSARAR